MQCQSETSAGRFDRCQGAGAEARPRWRVYPRRSVSPWVRGPGSAGRGASYVVMKRMPGETRPTRVTIGRTDLLTLSKARELAREAVAAVRHGVDVNAEKRREQLARKAERDQARAVQDDTGFLPGTFGELAIRYIRRECPSLRRGAEIEGIIRRRLLPLWGERQLGDLRRRDLTAIIDPVAAEGKTQAAHKLREIAIRVVNWAVDRGDIEMNFLTTASRGRRRADIIRRTAVTAYCGMTRFARSGGLAMPRDSLSGR